MENRTKFNLVNNIELWKLSFTNSNNLTKPDVIELENHLLDTIDDLSSKGLSKEESFIIASRRIGNTDDICVEYNKVNTSFSLFNKALPYLKGALAYIVFMNFSKLLFSLTFVIGQVLNVNSLTFNVFCVVVSIVAFLLFIIIFNSKHENLFIKKFSNIYVLSILLILSLIIIPLSNSLMVRRFYEPEDVLRMYHNFSFYRVFSPMLLVTTSLVFFWSNKKDNKLAVENE